ncbi:hypothetical protein KPL70_020916 [Citrus sinensis]|nr:hypothetical protein KPL70_020916 [Citrus sinensis]
METTSFIKFSLMSLIWIIVLMNEIHGYKACLETERTALLEIKSFFISVSDIGYDDKILPSWVGEDDGMSSDCCDDWEGVKCNATTRRVMQLSLNETIKFNYSSGSGSALLLNMSLFHPFEELQRLDLPGNWFTGIYENRAYDSFGSLKQLKMLNLGDNFFNDSILPYLNTLTSLTTLILSDNSIEGSRTKQGLANLRYLQVLDLSGNFNITSGSLTRLGLANLTNLKKLDLGSCGITTIQGLANLTNLQVLDLSDNQNLTTLARIRRFAKLENIESSNVDAGFWFSSLYDQDLCSINFFTTRRSPHKAFSPDVPAHTDKSEYAGCFPGANPPTLKSDMKASSESQFSAPFETAWDSDCCVMGKRGILRVTPRFCEILRVTPRCRGKRGCRGSVRSCVLRHGAEESVAAVPRFSGWRACLANCRRLGLLSSRPLAGMALCHLQEIGFADGCSCASRILLLLFSRAPGFYGAHRLAELCHQISAHHAWSRRRISPKHRSPSFWCWAM